MCFEFFKAGLFSIGGGLATLPFLQKMAENHPEWFTHEDLINMVAVAESTPGPIGVNVSTYAGFNTNGVLGGILATLSLVLPSFLCILIVYGFWQKYKENEKVQRTFSALRPAGLGLIVAACFTVFKGAVIPDGAFRWTCLLMFIIFFAVMQIPKAKKIHPLFYILLAAVIGIFLPL